MSNDNIDNIFKKALNNVDVPPSNSEDWGNMLSTLEKAGHVKTPIPFWKTGAAKLIYTSIATGAVALMLYFGLNSNDIDSNKNHKEISKIELTKNSNSTKDHTSEKEKSLKYKNFDNSASPKSDLNNENKVANDSEEEKLRRINQINKPDLKNSSTSSTNRKGNKNSLSNENASLTNKKQDFPKQDVKNKSNNNSNITNKNKQHNLLQNNSIGLNKNHTQNILETNSSAENISNEMQTKNSRDKIREQSKNEDLFAINGTSKNRSGDYLETMRTVDSRRAQLEIEFLNIKELAFTEESKLEDMIALKDSLEEKEKSKKSKTDFARGYIRPYFSIDYVFYTGLNDSSKVVVSKATANEMKFTAGILGGYNLWKGLYFETGILYSNKGTNAWAFDNVNNNSNEKATYYIKGHHIEIPLKLQYKFSKRFFSFYGSAGAHLKFNVSTGSFYELSNTETLKLYRINPNSSSVGASLVGNLGIEFNILPQLSFYIEPEFRYSLTPILMVPDYEITPINPYQHSLGIGVGLNYKFIK